MDIDKINSIIELFKNSGLDEMTLELKDFKINLKNNKVEYVTKEVVNVVEKSNSVKPVKEEKQVDDTNGEWIKAPFVGTFYAAPSANEAPYVKVGQKIKEGDIMTSCNSTYLWSLRSCSWSFKSYERGIRIS